MAATPHARDRRWLSAEAGRHQLPLALAALPLSFFDLEADDLTPDAPTLTCLRSVLMKPEHLDWLDPLWDRFTAPGAGI